MLWLDVLIIIYHSRSLLTLIFVTLLCVLDHLFLFSPLRAVPANSIIPYSVAKHKKELGKHVHSPDENRSVIYAIDLTRLFPMTRIKPEFIIEYSIASSECVRQSVAAQQRHCAITRPGEMCESCILMAYAIPFYLPTYILYRYTVYIGGGLKSNGKALKCTCRIDSWDVNAVHQTMPPKIELHAELNWLPGALILYRCIGMLSRCQCQHVYIVHIGICDVV